MKTNKSIKIFFKYVLGPVLFIWLSWTVYKQLQSAPDLDRQWNLLTEGFTGSGLLLLLGVIMLMVFQWSLEALKWKLMLKPVVEVGLFQALHAIFSGIAFSIVTPNRFGEFAGRILHLPQGTRLQGTAFTFIGNLTQLIITCIAGFFSLLIYQHSVRTSLTEYGLVLTVDMLLLCTPPLVLVLLFFFFGSRHVVKQLMKIPFLHRFEHQLFQLSSMPFVTLVYLFLLSALRFFVFIVQYWMAFQFAGIALSFGIVFGYIAVMLLWLAIVPTFSMAELGLRWQFALILFSPLSTQVLGIAFAVTAIWLVNFIIPALVGAVAVIGRKPVPEPQND